MPDSDKDRVADSWKADCPKHDGGTAKHDGGAAKHDGGTAKHDGGAASPKSTEHHQKRRKKHADRPSQAVLCGRWPYGDDVAYGADVAVGGWDKPSDDWKSDIATLNGECALVGKKGLVQLDHVVAARISALVREVKTEWVAYLVGEWMAPSHCYVSDILIPLQEVAYASCKTIEFPGEGDDDGDMADVVGVIHSHHTMGTFFSGTDETFVNANHSVSIVVATDDRYKATMRVLTECGRLVRVDADVEIVYPEPDGLGEFVTDAKKKMFEQRTVSFIWDRAQGRLVRQGGPLVPVGESEIAKQVAGQVTGKLVPTDKEIEEMLQDPYGYY